MNRWSCPSRGCIRTSLAGDQHRCGHTPRWLESTDTSDTPRLWRCARRCARPQFRRYGHERSHLHNAMVVSGPANERAPLRHRDWCQSQIRCPTTKKSRSDDDGHAPPFVRRAPTTSPRIFHHHIAKCCRRATRCLLHSPHTDRARHTNQGRSDHWGNGSCALHCSCAASLPAHQRACRCGSLLCHALGDDRDG